MMRVRHTVLLLITGTGALLALMACQPPEPTPPPRPTVIVVTPEGPYYEPFDEASSDWLMGDSARSNGWVEEGAYHLTIEEEHYLAWTNQQRAFGDGTYTVDVTLVRGPEASAYGLLLLGASDMRSFFYVMITADGRYDIGFCERGCQRQESLIDGFTLAYAILTGIGQPNHLAVTLDAGTLSLRVNGSAVGQVDGLSYEPGLVGFIGESSRYGGFEAAFDNLRVEE